MKKINFVDALFSNEGHYIDDIIKYEYLKNDYEIHYFVNEQISEENRTRLANFIIHEHNCGKSTIGQIKYFMLIKKNLNQNDFNFIMSCTYIPLFIFSILNRFYSYYLLVHFFPTVKVNLYRIILKYLLYNINGFIVFELFVKDSIINKLGIIKQNNILISHSRDIINIVKHVINNQKIKVSFVGSMNQNKDISLLVGLLKNNYYENIEFGFYSKGITQYLSKINVFNLVNVKDQYFSESEFNQYLNESDFLFLAYTDSYGVRFSGMLCDALSNGCQLICNNNASFKYYIENYNCGYIFNSECELHNILTNLKKLDINEKIYDDYSQVKRKKNFSKILNNFFK